MCAAMDLFPLYSCHRPECYEEMLLLCCVLLFLHSDMIVAHTSLVVSAREIILGENSFWNRGFFVDIRHNHPFVSQQSRHSLKSISFRDSALKIFSLSHLFTLRVFVLARNYTNVTPCVLKKNRIVQDTYLCFEK